MTTKSMPGRTEIAAIVRWYVDNVYDRAEGPRQRPFYSYRSRVGAFAVSVAALEARDEESHFRLLVLLSLYQSRRDVDVMAIQRDMDPSSVRALTSPGKLRGLIVTSSCEVLTDADSFDAGCDVYRDFTTDTVRCRRHPRTACHVKDAALAIRRMGDMGKLPTSALLHLADRNVTNWFIDACNAKISPGQRADVLVKRLSEIFRIGQKLATMYVTALTVPELGPAPWFPAVDGRRLVVIDANVARIIAHLRNEPVSLNYKATSTWLVGIAETIDLRRFDERLPRVSPRFVQQALYVFGSRSNRVARGDSCVHKHCNSCPSAACPFKLHPRVRHRERAVT